jgi:hypothetical protein
VYYVGKLCCASLLTGEGVGDESRARDEDRRWKSRVTTREWEREGMLLGGGESSLFAAGDFSALLPPLSSKESEVFESKKRTKVSFNFLPHGSSFGL